MLLQIAEGGKALRDTGEERVETDDRCMDRLLDGSRREIYLALDGDGCLLTLAQDLFRRLADRRDLLDGGSQQRFRLLQQRLQARHLLIDPAEESEQDKDQGSQDRHENNGED